jgi:hypothetical protein
METKKRPHAINAMAAGIVAEATAEEKPLKSSAPKNPYAVELGRLGGQKGGKARAAKLTSEERKAIAQKAAQARWNPTEKD